MVRSIPNFVDVVEDVLDHLEVLVNSNWPKLQAEGHKDGELLFGTVDRPSADLIVVPFNVFQNYLWQDRLLIDPTPINMLHHMIFAHFHQRLPGL
jgi:hypothetical protein